MAGQALDLFVPRRERALQFPDLSDNGVVFVLRDLGQATFGGVGGLEALDLLAQDEDLFFELAIFAEHGLGLDSSDEGAAGIDLFSGGDRFRTELAIDSAKVDPAGRVEVEVRDGLAVDHDAIGRAEIAEAIVVALLNQLGMVGRHAAVADLNGIVGEAPHADARPLQFDERGAFFFWERNAEGRHGEVGPIC